MDNKHLPSTTTQTQDLIKRVGLSLKLGNQLLQKRGPTAEEWAWWNNLSPIWKKILTAHLYDFNKVIKHYDEFKKTSHPSSILEEGLGQVDLNNPGDLKSILKLTQMIILGLDIQDLNALKELKNLTELDLSFNKISDISALKELKNLTTLYLGDNQISDISALKELKNLTELDLSFNKISDISALEELKNLTELNLDGASISFTYLKWLKEQLPNCRISHW